MNQPSFALVTKLGKEDPRFDREGSLCFPSDIGKCSNDEYYQIFKISDHRSGFSQGALEKYVVLRVIKILDAPDGYIKWKVLN